MKVITRIGLVLVLVAVIAVIVVFGLNTFQKGIFSPTNASESGEESFASEDASTSEDTDESSTQAEEPASETEVDGSETTSDDSSEATFEESSEATSEEAIESSSPAESSSAPSVTPTEPQPTSPVATTYRGVTLPIPATYPERKASTAEIQAAGGFRDKAQSGKVIYLLFTIGVEYGYTPQILDILKAKAVPASFFISVGQVNYDTKNGTNYVARMASEGHLIGNHGATHSETATLTDAQLVDNILNTEPAVAAYLGSAYHIQYYMPPGGTISMRDLYVASALGLTPVSYSWNYYDYNIREQMSGAEALEKMKSGLGNGRIYYLHSRPCTTEALAAFIDYAQSQGYEFRRLDQ